MFVIQDILVSDDLIKQQFLCNLTACKGACCYEGDLGAPLHDSELEILDEILDELSEFLEPNRLEQIRKEGSYKYYKDLNSYGTNLENGGPCVFMTTDELGIACCGIEKAWKAGKTKFRKPISCHLYPVRITENKITGFTAANYDQWDICKAACKSGKKEKVPLYKFVKDALIRRFGEEFYEELEAAVEYSKNKNE
ncbi:MAG TPA: DUF3109 family protein [Saprospiraceae bacterium]|nr:DUF3109 family protein [Saprospiraceae bacterium]